MIRLLADENLPPALMSALGQKLPGIKFQTTRELQAVGLSDPEILELAASQQQVIVTMDHRTMPGYAAQRVAAGAKMPGVIVIHSGRTLRELVDDLELMLRCLRDQDFENQVIHLPLT